MKEIVEAVNIIYLEEIKSGLIEFLYSFFYKKQKKCKTGKNRNFKTLKLILCKAVKWVFKKTDFKESVITILIIESAVSITKIYMKYNWSFRKMFSLMIFFTIAQKN